MKCKTFLEFDEISQPQNHSHAKILFVQAFVIASLNVILPEENSDINSAIKILFIDILKDYGAGLFKAYSQFKSLERNEDHGIRANKYCVYCAQELYNNSSMPTEEIGCCLSCNLYAFHDKCSTNIESEFKDSCPYCILSNEIEKCMKNPRSIVLDKNNLSDTKTKYIVNK